MAEPTRTTNGDPFAVVALAGAGTLGAHELGYLVEPTSGAVSHAHLGLLAPLALFAVCVVGWSAAVRILRQGSVGRPRFTVLLAIQVGLYTALEVGERVVVGDLASLASAPVVLGLLLQPLIAGLAVVLARAGGAVLARIAARRRALPVATTLPARSGSPAVLVPLAMPHSCLPRGPPVG